MKKLILTVLIMLCTTLCGCTQASQVENHTYVLVMGLDMTEENQIRMTVLAPKISGGSDKSSGSAGNESYTHFSVLADDYEAALAKLNWASPRDLTLSQLKLIVISRELAETPTCRQLIENIAQTERLYTAARIAVCEERAGDFVKAIQPTIGTRISEDIEAMYDHYTDSGYVPKSSLAELYYLTESIYSDPMVTYALLDQRYAKQNKDQDSMPAAALSGGLNSISSEYESNIATRYLGAAVFSEGKMRGLFTGEDCIMAMLIRNEIKSIRYECGGQTLDIVPARAVFVDVDTGQDTPKIRINAHLAVAAQEKRPDEKELRASIEQDMRSVISAAQQMNTEPFGFAEKAAAHFATIDHWKEFDWKTQFRNADIEIELHFAHSDA